MKISPDLPEVDTSQAVQVEQTQHEWLGKEPEYFAFDEGRQHRILYMFLKDGGVVVFHLNYGDPAGIEAAVYFRPSYRNSRYVTWPTVCGPTRGCGTNMEFRDGLWREP